MDEANLVADRRPRNTNRLLNRLKALRLKLAAERGVPTYVVFSDATLAQVAERCPTSESELLQVPGVGRTRVARYGKLLLRALVS